MALAFQAQKTLLDCRGAIFIGQRKRIQRRPRQVRMFIDEAVDSDREDLYQLLHQPPKLPKQFCRCRFVRVFVIVVVIVILVLVVLVKNKGVIVIVVLVKNKGVLILLLVENQGARWIRCWSRDIRRGDIRRGNCFPEIRNQYLWYDGRSRCHGRTATQRVHPWDQPIEKCGRKGKKGCNKRGEACEKQVEENHFF